MNTGTAVNKSWSTEVTPINNISLSRGDIWTVREVRSERREGTSVQQGSRPYLIVQSDLGSDSPVIEAAPISASLKSYDHLFIQNILLERESQIHLEQSRPVPRSNFVKKIGHLSLEKMIEMDMRLAIPYSLDKSSILHIESIVVNAKETYKGELVCWATVTYKFFEKRVRFTKQQFINFFGPDKAFVLDYHLTYISEFLDSIQGMKFVYSLIMEREEELYLQHKNDSPLLY